MLNYQQRAAYVECMLAYEMKQLGMQAPIEIHRYKQDRGIHTALEFIAEPERRRIAWNTDAVDWYPMEQIVQEMIFCLQRYQWYAVLTATERVAFADDWQALQLVCSRFCRESSVLAYDLLTNHYVYVRADWYCKYD